jgi:predicted enzyme related to lactoylglutathione lyase
VSVDYVQIISIPVSDQERARDFYVECLGWRLLHDRDTGDRRWVEVAPPGGETSFTLVTWFPSMPPGSLKGIVLSTEDIDTTYAELSERGVRFTSPISDGPWSRITGFDDPDGNGLVLHQLYEPRPRSA